MKDEKAFENSELNDLSEITISFNETHHIRGNRPLYDKRFKKVMSFHAPGVAAVEAETGAFHIDLNGDEIYRRVYEKSFGYYEGLASVKDSAGFFHIDLAGKPLYEERYSWAGNFQEGRCPMRDKQGQYFHIKKNGESAYDEKYKYIGDFKYGIAVVSKENGLSTHIDKSGNFIHGKFYRELGVFHKGFATATDDNGMFHIDKTGGAIYKERYKWVEPFYNGQAIVCCFNEERLIIDEKGQVIHNIYDQATSTVQDYLRNKLLGMLVGNWSTQVIKSIVELEILDLIKAGFNTKKALLNETRLPVASIEMIIRILKVWDFIKISGELLEVKYLGNLLTRTHPSSFAHAALMWGSEHYIVMSRLTEALKQYTPQFERIYGQPLFEYFNSHEERGNLLSKGLDSYSIDYDGMINCLDCSSARTLLDVGGGLGTLLIKLLKRYQNIEKGILFDLPSVVQAAKEQIRDLSIKKRMNFVSGDFFKKIPVCADIIVMSRILHDWCDDKALVLLKNIKRALNPFGILILLEIIVPEDIESDLGALLNFNLLVNVGGKERTRAEFDMLLEKSGFKIQEVKYSKEIVSLIIAEKIIKRK